MYGTDGDNRRAEDKVGLFLEHIMPEIVSLIPGNDAALDVGCGNGRLSKHLGDVFEKVVGIDPLVMPIFKHPNVEYQIEPVLDHVPDQSYDLILLWHVMYDMGEDTSDVADHLGRLLSPGGLLVIADDKRRIRDRYHYTPIGDNKDYAIEDIASDSKTFVEKEMIHMGYSYVGFLRDRYEQMLGS
jgi:2-polyprenyl-3-methyl-5-hydroxy-6-metoxy-1,4-benzoquinol methylase